MLTAGDDLNLNPPFLTNGIQAVQVFDPVNRTIEHVATLQRGRWYASVMTLSDGNLLILGGIQQVRQSPLTQRAMPHQCCDFVSFLGCSHLLAMLITSAQIS